MKGGRTWTLRGSTPGSLQDAAHHLITAGHKHGLPVEVPKKGPQYAFTSSWVSCGCWTTTHCRRKGSSRKRALTPFTGGFQTAGGGSGGTRGDYINTCLRVYVLATRVVMMGWRGWKARRENRKGRRRPERWQTRVPQRKEMSGKRMEGVCGACSVYEQHVCVRCEEGGEGGEGGRGRGREEDAGAGELLVSWAGTRSFA